MPTYILRRIQKEIQRDWENDEQDIDSSVIFSFFSDGICNFVALEDSFGFNHPMIQISINFNNSNFPFGPPKNINVNTLNYSELIRFNSNSYNDLERISGQKCLCCSSILCPNNWTTQKSMKDIVSEVIENIKLKQRIVEIIHGKKIVDKYFGFYLPIIEYL